MRLAPVTIVVAVIAGAVVSIPLSAEAAPQSDSVQVLAINDLHGRIARTAGVDSRLVTAPGPDGVYGAGEGGDMDDVFTHVGGAAHMATLVEEHAHLGLRLDAGALLLFGVSSQPSTAEPLGRSSRDATCLGCMALMSVMIW